MSDKVEAKIEADKTESTVPYFGKIFDSIASAAFGNRRNDRVDSSLLPSVEFVNPKGEKETHTTFKANGTQYEIDDSPSDPSHLYRVDYDGRRDAIEPGEAARARAAFEELKNKK